MELKSTDKYYLDPELAADAAVVAAVVELSAELTAGSPREDS